MSKIMKLVAFESRLNTQNFDLKDSCTQAYTYSYQGTVLKNCREMVVLLLIKLPNYISFAYHPPVRAYIGTPNGYITFLNQLAIWELCLQCLTTFKKVARKFHDNF